MRKLVVDKDMVVINIINDLENVARGESRGIKYIKKFDENVQIGDVVDSNGHIVVSNNLRYSPSDEERAQHYEECIRDGTYTLDGNGELCPITPRND